MQESTIVKKKLLASYISGIFDREHGDSCGTILTFFLPEFVTALLIYSLLYLVDARWIAALQSTSIYATVGTTNTMLHFLMKVAEGFSVGTVVMAGNYNGRREFKEAGKVLANAFWATVLAGCVVAFILYAGAYWIFVAYGVPEKMIVHGVPFLRLRSISIFLMFVYFAIVGFLRGIKQPKVAMYVFILGSGLFLFFDYALIFGYFGFSRLEALGSAWASIVQYGSMVLFSLIYLAYSRSMQVYNIHILRPQLDIAYVKELWKLSWPVMLDKGLFAGAYLWLGIMISPMGKYAIASYTVIKDLERVAILPAAAFAQVITYLVSNAYGINDWEGIKSNIKKTVFLSSLFVFSILAIFSVWPDYFISLFDFKNKFTDFAARAFPILSVLVFFDLLQLILSGALRGAKNVKTVMIARLVTCVFYFMPVSLLFSRFWFATDFVRFILVYGSFYVGSGLMSIAYIARFRNDAWKDQES